MGSRRVLLGASTLPEFQPSRLLHSESEQAKREVESVHEPLATATVKH